VNKILSTVLEVNEARYRRIPTSQLNKLMRDAVDRHPPPQQGGVRVKFFFATQASVAPPTLVFFVNKPEVVHFSYQRYLENRIREEFPFPGTPLRLVFRPRSEDRFAEKT
jgi:GTPase